MDRLFARNSWIADSPDSGLPCRQSWLARLRSGACHPAVLHSVLHNSRGGLPDARALLRRFAGYLGSVCVLRRNISHTRHVVVRVSGYPYLSVWNICVGLRRMPMYKSLSSVGNWRLPYLLQGSWTLRCHSISHCRIPALFYISIVAIRYMI